jgi:threonylcarbamoyladenosine tRNA methylthiotransferase MtaB
VTRVFLHTFGCKANQYDSEVIRQALEAAGATIVDDPSSADAAVVNSCTVTHVGEGKMRGYVRRLARVRPEIRTVVVGCAAALDDGTIAALPQVRDVIGGAEPADVLRSLELPVVQQPTALRTFQRGTRAWLKIQDGCDEHCTFCATTAARGANRSRPPEEIVTEAAALTDQHQEVVLTGVHIGTYGRDLGASYSLGRLLETLVERVPAVRFRLSSVEATEVDDRLLDLMTSMPDRLAPHLHAPLQSGSDRVLKRMGRHWYTASEYCRRVERMAAQLPRFGLGADVMVGFPGESDTDFAATREVVARLPFTYLHVFPYSERPTAVAQRLGPTVDSQVARDRSAALRALAAEKGAAYRRRRAGEQADIVTLARRAGRYEGLTEDYLAVGWHATGAADARFTAPLLLEPDDTLAPALRIPA